MAVHKGEAAGAMMIAAGQIIETDLLRMVGPAAHVGGEVAPVNAVFPHVQQQKSPDRAGIKKISHFEIHAPRAAAACAGRIIDRKSTRLNSSHRCISYAVFCLKKKN